MDVYGVTPADVAAQVPALFPNGFSATTKPATAVVASWIATADGVATLAVRAATGASPDPAVDESADLAKQFVILWTLAMVMRAVYAGNAPDQVRAAAQQYQEPANQLLEQLRALGPQATGDGVSTSRIRSDASGSEDDDRALVIGNAELGRTGRRF